MLTSITHADALSILEKVNLEIEAGREADRATRLIYPHSKDHYTADRPLLAARALAAWFVPKTSALKNGYLSGSSDQSPRVLGLQAAILLGMELERQNHDN
jgi:hypothetical protein